MTNKKEASATEMADDIPLRAEGMEEILEAPELLLKPDTEALEAELSELRKALEASQEKAKDNWERLLRKEAELQNAQKRFEQNLSETRQFAIKGLLQDLLGVLDSLDKGLELAQDADPALAEGMALTQKMMLDTVEKQGLEAIDPIGAVFDPQAHEALTMQVSDEVAPNHILTVIQKGYRLHARLIRSAKVIVAKEA